MGRSTEALSEEEEAQLVGWCRAAIGGPWDWYAKLVLLFLATGIHPAVIAHPDDYHLRIYGTELRWLRPKTMKPVRFPIPVEFRAWLPGFLAELPTVTPYRFSQRVQRATAAAGLPGVGPRTLRHTAASRIVAKYGIVVAKQLLEVTDAVLMRYANRAASRAALDSISRDPF